MIKNKVAIPDSCFMIVLVMDRFQGVQDATASTEIIAVIMPNDDTATGKWFDYKSTVDEIER